MKKPEPKPEPVQEVEALQVRPVDETDPGTLFRRISNNLSGCNTAHAGAHEMLEQIIGRTNKFAEEELLLLLRTCDTLAVEARQRVERIAQIAKRANWAILDAIHMEKEKANRIGMEQLVAETSG